MKNIILAIASLIILVTILNTCGSDEKQSLTSSELRSVMVKHRLSTERERKLLEDKQRLLTIEAEDKAKKMFCISNARDTARYGYKRSISDDVITLTKLSNGKSIVHMSGFDLMNIYGTWTHNNIALCIYDGMELTSFSIN